MHERVDETSIRDMVERFYARVRDDGVLGPIFEDRVRGNWPVHLDKMVDFWSSALLAAGRYAGNPRAAHAKIGGLSVAHFDRWLQLFEQTLAECFDPYIARSIYGRAQAMARGLLRGIDNHRPGLPLTETAEKPHV